MKDGQSPVKSQKFQNQIKSLLLLQYRTYHFIELQLANIRISKDDI